MELQEDASLAAFAEKREKISIPIKRWLMSRSGNKKMPFLLRYHPDVRKIDLPLLDEKAKTQIWTAIEKRLQTAPQDYGEPLRKTLKGYWKLRVGNYRSVYKNYRVRSFDTGYLPQALFI